MTTLNPIHHDSSGGHAPIEVYDEEGSVEITFYPEESAADEDAWQITRTLAPGEARALAAMLVHYSFEAGNDR